MHGTAEDVTNADPQYHYDAYLDRKETQGTLRRTLRLPSFAGSWQP